MPDAAVIYTRKDHIAPVILDRAEANNVINQQVAEKYGKP